MVRSTGLGASPEQAQRIPSVAAAAAVIVVVDCVDGRLQRGRRTAVDPGGECGQAGLVVRMGSTSPSSRPRPGDVRELLIIDVQRVSGPSRASNWSRTHLSPARRPWSRTSSRPTSARDVGVHGKARILRREHPLPQAHLQAADDSIPGARRPAATHSCGAQRTLPSPPGSRPASAGWLGSPRPARATPIPPSHLTFALPGHDLIPAGTTTSADSCPVSSRLTAEAVGDTTAQPAPGQISPDRNDQFPPTPAAFT